MSSSSPNFSFPGAFNKDPPEIVLAIPIAAEANDALFWTGTASIIVPGSVDFPHDHSSPITMKLEAEFETHATSGSQVEKQKEEWAIYNGRGDSKPTAEAAMTWQPSGDLMEIIFNDTIPSELGFRLEDDTFIAANKESARSVFGVIRFMNALT